MNQTCITPQLPSLQQLGLEELRQRPIPVKKEGEERVQMITASLKIDEIMREVMAQASAPAWPEPVDRSHFSEQLMEESLNEASRKRKRQRLSFEQTQYLLNRFEEKCYPQPEEYKRFSLDLNMPVSKLRQWFQNKRARVKKLK